VAAKAAALNAKTSANADTAAHDDTSCIDPTEGNGRFA
jgi:hypothetical protein